MKHRGVAQMELGPIREHQRDGVTGLYAKCGEAGGDVMNAFTILTPGDAD